MCAKANIVMELEIGVVGGSGSLLEEIREALDYGVVKMNVDTDTQYAFTRPVAAHMFTNYDGVLKVDGEVGNKKLYDPRSWGKSAEAPQTRGSYSFLLPTSPSTFSTPS